MKSVVVQKYGGTSMGDIERIQNVARRVVERKRTGKAMIVVVSAMGKTTDQLVHMATELNPNPSAREMDMLLSTGEQVSISLLAMAIEALGEKAISLTGAQCGIKTDAHHKKARIESINTDRMLEAFESDHIVIVAGFQGVSDFGDITTLGRGGSDTTAVALAAAVGAEKCEIYTDVDGVFTTDPRKVPDARQLPEISYDEMLELAKLGAKVLHPRSVELARKYKVPLVVRSSFNDNEGTQIVEVSKLEKVQVRGVTADPDIARISVSKVPDTPGIAFQLFSQLAKQNVSLDMIIQNLNHDEHNDISFTVPIDDLAEATGIATAFSEEIGGGEVIIKKDVSKVSIVGTGITGNAEVASLLFGTLSKLGINIEMISTSEIKISCIIDAGSSDLAVTSLHNAFELGLGV
jgi:aspartate kinase